MESVRTRMKQVVVLAFLSVILATSAFAQGGVNLNASPSASADCAGSGTIIRSIVSSCTGTSGAAFSLVASVVPAKRDPDFIGAATLIDVQSSSAALPDWWRADQNGCRAGAVTIQSDASISPGCPTLWDNRSDVLSVFAVQPLVGGPNRVLLNAGSAVSESITIPGDGTTEFGVLKLTVSKTKSGGAGACAGCMTGACLTLNEINFQPASVTASWTRFTNPTADGSNVVTWQNTPSPCSGGGVAKNRSWGAVKALYR
jgi:hypothetical protein